jgi:hypothetical protein
MKSSARLIRQLCVLFGTLRWVMILNLVVTAMVSFFATKPELSSLLGFADVHFIPGSAPIKIVRDTQVRGELYLVRLQGKLSLKNATEEDGLLWLARWTHVISSIAPSVLLLVVFEFLRRLCRNIERREVFTDENFGLVRRLGGIIVALTLISSAVHAWKAYRIERYLREHVSFEGISSLTATSPLTGKEAFIDSVTRNVHLDFSLLLTGLLVLVLAEVFRQGVALKQESDLTV